MLHDFKDDERADAAARGGEGARSSVASLPDTVLMQLRAGGGAKPAADSNGQA